MKILLSPAKTLDYDTKLPTSRGTQPAFVDEAIQINAKLERQTKKEIQELMGVSEKLADLNYQRYKDFKEEHDKSVARPAIYAFAGDVYSGFDAYSMDTELLDDAQDRIRILSGMYGVLRPLDLLQPYRLEMGTKLPIELNKDLYEFWKDKITPELNKEMKDDELLVNLASNEYFKAIDKKNQKGTLISPVFKDYKNGKLKIIAFYAKKARGVMARYLVEQKANSLNDILKFAGDDYQYSEKDTVKENEPVFTR
ncbi:hypothetical protein SAMN05192588_1741 [Nonlabens sp. Hel1_33_55]|uniref:peroxide stress protein YaaA n=1 Tax=Nonlabens sp. Hel1_33_55 TaxID=1336802 RepID=UPI000875DB1C|nr:peroxide stress protein YaaA [Nonlabens sp. Hel1_33_55]SCY22215.1 hypothetical protein SAMN05192588_1741 [Nonlabens sp. Hel1_33_55]